MEYIVCGQVWFEMSATDQVDVLAEQNYEVKVLACGCEHGQNCQEGRG
jgi:hypothetical protein